MVFGETYELLDRLLRCLFRRKQLKRLVHFGVRKTLPKLSSIVGRDAFSDGQLTDTTRLLSHHQKHCPNGRIPALIDNSQKSLDGTDAPFAVFETGAILLYLAKFYDKNDIFGFTDPLERSDALQWMFWQHGGLGPMQGQLNHFGKYAPEKIPYAIKRYTDETKRLYSVLEGRLSGEFTGAGEREWLAGKGKGKYSWAEMMNVSPGLEALDPFKG